MIFSGTKHGVCAYQIATDCIGYIFCGCSSSPGQEKISLTISNSCYVCWQSNTRLTRDMLAKEAGGLNLNFKSFSSILQSFLAALVALALISPMQYNCGMTWESNLTIVHVFTHQMKVYQQALLTLMLEPFAVF